MKREKMLKTRNLEIQSQFDALIAQHERDLAQQIQRERDQKSSATLQKPSTSKPRKTMIRTKKNMQITGQMRKRTGQLR